VLDGVIEILLQHLASAARDKWLTKHLRQQPLQQILAQLSTH
jgi:hypothetical protein